MTDTLWAVHVTGPDDLLPCASRRLAVRNATWMNLSNSRTLPRLDEEHWPLVYAAPVSWTGTKAEHAEALARENAEDARWSDSDVDVLRDLMLELTGMRPATIVYEIECPHGCDEPAVIRSLDLGQPEDDGAIHIDVGMSVAQSKFTCTKCGCDVYTDDVDGTTEDEECPAVDSDDEDDELDDEDSEGGASDG